MGIVTSIVVFQVFWWVIFLMSLPFGVKIPEVYQKGNAESAPINPGLKEKARVTTWISLLLTLITYGVITSGVLNWVIEE